MVLNLKKLSQKLNNEELDDEDDDDLNIDLDLDTNEQIDNIKEAFIDLEDIQIIDEELEEITEDIQVSESEKRYSIEMQTSDLLDELLSSIPSNERTNDS